MANNYFRFKEFTIHQNHSAMRVTTDACLFGAWVAENMPESKQVLDIGGGTGLLSLMLVQKKPATVYAVEKDEATCTEMRDNFQSSPWANQLHALHENILHYQPGHTFDFIVTNPPFFEHSLKSPDPARNRVMHDTDLTIAILIQLIDKFTDKIGAFAILLPYERAGFFTSLAATHGFSLSYQSHVRQTPRHPYFRSMLLFNRKTEGSVTESTIVIKGEDGIYTAEFIQLLQPYYLFL